jgi:hypothetical protein
MADGTTSLYISNGSGIIGAGDHKPVRNAAVAFLADANDCVNSAEPARTFPLPGAGQVVFYFLSYGGVLSYSAVHAKLEQGTDQLSSLFHSGHRVLAETLKLRSTPAPVEFPRRRGSS